MTFDAKKIFTEFTPANAASFRQMVETPEFQIAAAMALAQMATNGATTEQMQGADVFIQILGNIGEPKAPPPKFPVKTLVTYEPGYAPKKEAK